MCFFKTSTLLLKYKSILYYYYYYLYSIMRRVINIKNIIFDLGGVILKNKPISVLENINVNNSEYNELKKFFDNWEELDLGKETLNDKFIKCNFSNDIEKMYKEILIHYYKYRELNEELISIIKKLKKNNYNVYILSDNNSECYEYYKKNDLFKDIDGWVLSCEYNTKKKDGILFDILINKFSLNPYECYFIDDRESNIDEAKKHGIRGYLFNEKNDIIKLYDDMRNNHINI